MNLPCNRVFPLILVLSIPACTQVANSISSTTRPQDAGWYLEQTDQGIPIVSARLNGEASHGDRISPAMVQVTCNQSRPRVVISLFTSTDQLGFKTGAYEGPTATTTGPLSLTTGNHAPRDYAVNGIYTAEEARKGDFVFNLYEATHHRELLDWATDTSRGQPVSMTLPSAVMGDPPLLARFVLPQDNSGLRKVIEPCMNTSGPEGLR